jgi:hypothetical protein
MHAGFIHNRALADFFGHARSAAMMILSGFDTVGGPVEVAALTKYEGFKWVKRKHYYDKGLNT